MIKRTEGQRTIMDGKKRPLTIFCKKQRIAVLFFWSVPYSAWLDQERPRAESRTKKLRQPGLHLLTFGYSTTIQRTKKRENETNIALSLSHNHTLRNVTSANF